jgi:hypothetical protein
MLIALSNLFSNFGEDRVQLQLINVLSQIAFGYVICFLILQLQPAWQVASGVMLLAVQWALFVVFPGPQGAFSPVGNVGQVIDRAVLGYTYQGYYVTINFIGNAVVILFGCWTGLLLRARRPPAFTLKALCAATVGRVPDRLLRFRPSTPWSSAVDGVVQLPRRGVGDRRDGRALLGDRRARLEAVDVPLRRAWDELDLRLRVLAASRRMAGSRSRDVHRALRISWPGRRDSAPTRGARRDVGTVLLAVPAAGSS